LEQASVEKQRKAPTRTYRRNRRKKENLQRVGKEKGRGREKEKGEKGERMETE
jgi:hypothetical protein